MMYDQTMDYFRQISQIPRCSKKEDKIRAYLTKRATDKGLDIKIDDCGNVVVYVPATLGRESEETIILQAHMDMVCVQVQDSEHDFDVDPIEILIDGDRMGANGTTLGADNGVGMAMCMSASDLDNHPALELLFTVDEEQGLTGALNLDETLLSGKQLINLDTEDLGEICISSAGGARIDVNIPLTRIHGDLPQYEVRLSGFQGGHSGVDIDKSRGSAIASMVEMLDLYDGLYELVSIDGGVADNALAPSVTTILGLEDPSGFQSYMQSQLSDIQQIIDAPDSEISLQALDDSYDVIIPQDQLIHTINQVKHGIVSMSRQIEGLVQTSINLGIIETMEDLLKITYAPRSSLMTELDGIISDVQSNYKLINADTSVRSKYPGRQEDPSGSLVGKVKSVYRDILGQEPRVVAYHAGLECGALVEKLGNGAQAVSFGPTIQNPHSPQERCNLPSVEVCCRVVEALLGGA